MAGPSHFVGAMLVSTDGAVIEASGVGTDARINALVTDEAWLAALRERRILTISGEKTSYIAVYVALPSGGVLLISEPPSDVVLEFIASVDFAYDILHHLITDPFSAMNVVDADAKIAYLSPIHESFFGIGRGEAIGQPVTKMIENTRMHEVVRTGKAEIGHLQKMKGEDRVVTRVPIERNGRIVGAIGRVMFKGPHEAEALVRRVTALQSEVEFYRREAAALRGRSYGIDAIIGESPAIKRLRADIIKIAPLQIPVLIHGESGTGKELVAHALHQLSPRRDKPMVLVNAAAIPPTLVEAELFGYEPGSFTGADRKGRKGKFEQANDFTIFLDEIGDMPLEIQARLLRVVQDRLVERVGSDRVREVDFRLISATNRQLDTLVAGGDFRLDLYYRVSPLIIEVPPLRKRRSDIPLLVRTFLADFAERHRMGRISVAGDVLDFVSGLDWPGNVRQLRAEVERAAVFCENGEIRQKDFERLSLAPDGAGQRTGEAPDLKSKLDQVELHAIQMSLARNKGNKKRAAEELGISRSYLYKRLAELAD